MTRNPWLTAGGGLSAAASALHIAILFGGPSWYRFFGAGPRVVHLAERGYWTPPAMAVGIAAVLAIWAAYALSGAGLLPRLLLLKPALVAITAVYLLRAFGYIPLLALNHAPVGAFAWISSAIVLVFGLVHLIGTWRLWTD